MARTRSQPLSPSGYQMWQTPPRTRRQTAEAAPAAKPAPKAAKAPKPATTRVNKSKAKKSKKPAPKKRLPGSYDDSDDEQEAAPAAESSNANGNSNRVVNNNNDHSNNAGNDNNTVTAPTPRHNPSPSTPQVQVLVPSPQPVNGPTSTHATPSTPTPASQTAARNSDALHVSPVAETTANVENNDNTRNSIDGNQAPSQSEPNNISSRPIMPLPRRLPQRRQPFSLFSSIASLISPNSLEVSPTPVIDLAGGVTRNGEHTSPDQLLYYPPRTSIPPTFFSSPNSTIQRRPLCPCCDRALVCPSNHPTWTHDGFRFAERLKQLTPVQAVTGKRRRETDEDKENVNSGNQTAREEQRPAKKVQRKPIKSREIHRRRQVTPYADRQRRRALESQGKIQRTLFRIPELIAQKKAAEAASLNGNNNSANYDDQSDLEVTSIPADVTTTALDLASTSNVTNMHSSPPELQPSTPSRAGWSFGGLLGSVPRSISRFLPAFGAEPSQNEGHDVHSQSQSHRPVMHRQNLSENLSNEAEQLNFASRTHENDDDHHNYESVSPSAHAVGPSISEEWKDTPTALPAQVVSAPVRGLVTEQQTQQEDDEEEDLSYDLFPRNHRLSSYSREAALRQAEEDARLAREEVRLAQEAARQAQEEARLAKEEARQAHETAKLYQPSSSKANANRVAKRTGKEKKRKPIPNPPGCSYGMDLRYFGSTSSSEAESSDNERPDTQSASVRPGVLRTAASADNQTPAGGALRQRKQVRFGPSPPDVPSKMRLSAPGEVMDDIPESPSLQAAAPATPAPQPISTIPSPEDVEMTTPSPLEGGSSDNETRGQNTYGFTYEELYGDDFFDDIDEDPVPSGAGASSSSGIVEEVGVLPPPVPRGILFGHSNGQIAAAPPVRPSLATMPVPLHRPATIGAMAAERQRSDMERFRPRFPSTLRTAERYSSSPVPASSPALQGAVGQGPLPHSFQWPRAAETGFSLEARPSNDRLRMGLRQLMKHE
ncbi:hypothetical protein FQN49_005117 [Arthroderma sp. PD_2]|nr:hypothetical protein FQN49_005117 [Arthroderma sp. PD_2]